MNPFSTLVQSLFIFNLCSQAQAADDYTVRVRGEKSVVSHATSPFTLFFDPAKNNIQLERQRIDFDLTKETELRLGPYILDESKVSMQVSRELSEFKELDFGFDTVKKNGPIYVLSFRWPTDYIEEGVLELIDEQAQSLWRRNVSKKDVEDWQKVVGFSKVHMHTQFGLSHKGFFEIPIPQIASVFRFCLSSEQAGSRLALCSRRYQFSREGGQYIIHKVTKEVTPVVMVNDKPVALKGSAIFLDNDVPIKLSALLKSGTYFEFVSHPKDIRLVDVIQNDETGKVELIGYGDAPVGEVTESFYVDHVNWGFLNFMPTIGDLRKFWKSQFNVDAHYLYLKGQGGAPFRQNLEYESLPTRKARIELSNKTTKSTYLPKVWVKGKVQPEVKIDADDTETKRLSESEFEWNFPAPMRGGYNKSYLNVYENDKKWQAVYEIYRGYSAEVGLRLTGVLTSNLTLILMAEAAGQFWFENIFGWDSYTFSHQRWGLAGKYFEAVKGTKNSLSKLAAGNVDIKYRFTPGVWGRDPTVGMILSGLNLDYGFTDDLGRVSFSVPVLGGGMFWARSMPRFMDDLFNLVPFMRYPKWVDWEFIYYPYTLREKQSSKYMFAMNFHGKVQWTEAFFGEAGFGVKNLTFSDHHFNDPEKQLDPSVAILYSQVGLGFNF